MSATSPSSEHFGWERHNEDPEVWWAEAERAKRAEAKAERRTFEARREGLARQAVLQTLHILRQCGLLREDCLSYTRICELEHETGIATGSWTDYLHALHEAELEDRKAWKS